MRSTPTPFCSKKPLPIAIDRITGLAGATVTIFRTRHAPDLFCDRNTTLHDFLGVRVLLLHNCPNFPSQKRNEYRPAPMPQPFPSHIPHTPSPPTCPPPA